MYECSCECGTTGVEVTRSSLLKGDTRSCGCLHAAAGEAAKEDLTGRRFERWRVIGPASRKVSESGKTRRSMWLCECDCGTRKEVGARALKTGMSTSCGCLQKERVSEALTDDLTGREFGFLTVKYRNGSYRPKSGAKAGIRAVWHCECRCGGECDVTGELLKSGDVTSCGCRKTSKYEDFTKACLEDAGFVEGDTYFREKTYDGLTGVGGGPLRIDFVVSIDGNDVWIECQGEQHSKATKWYGGEEYLARLQEHDRRKKEFAAQHGLRLVEIPFTANTKEKIGKLLRDNFVTCTGERRSG